jgi:hypothetical protein
LSVSGERGEKEGRWAEGSAGPGKFGGPAGENKSRPTGKKKREGDGRWAGGEKKERGEEGRWAAARKEGERKRV